MSRIPANHPRGLNRKPKGITRTRNGRLEQRESLDDAWRLAVPHHDVRDRLIQRAAALGTYQHARTHGDDPLDVTTFLPRDRDWGYDRAQRPPVLFQIRQDETSIHTRPATVMTLNGMVLLDHDDHEIPDWPELPATLSTQVTGQEIEYFRRLNREIHHADLIGK